MAKVKVPVLGTIGKAIFIDSNATVGATIGVDLRLPDGSVPSLSQLAAALGVTQTDGSGSLNGTSVTLWRLIQEKPPNIVQVAALATNGLVVRQPSGNWITRNLAVQERLTVVNADGDGGNPTIDLADLAAVSVLGNASNATAKPSAVTSSGDKAVLHQSGTSLSFSTIDATYVSDFAEAAQDAVGGILTDTADIDFTYNDAGPSISASLTATIHASLDLADSAVQPGDLALVAFSGDYADLVNTPADISGSDFVTFSDETATLPNSRRLAAGTNVTFDTTVAGVLTINASGGGGSGTVTSVGVTSTDLSVSGSPVTTSGNITLNINDDAVTYAKIQNVSATNRILGRITAGAGNIEELTAANVATIINSSLDHGALAGLGDNDHPQYARHASAETISALWRFDRSANADVISFAHTGAIKGYATVNTTGFGFFNGTTGGGSGVSIRSDVDEVRVLTASAERFRFGALGQFGIGGATYGSAGQVFTSGGASAAPTWSSVTATAGGSNTQVQYNNSGSLGGAGSLTYNSSSGAVTFTGTYSTGNPQIRITAAVPMIQLNETGVAANSGLYRIYGDATNLIIDAALDNESVSGIAMQVTRSTSSVSTVTFPSGLFRIGSGPFVDVGNLGSGSVNEFKLNGATFATEFFYSANEDIYLRPGTASGGVILADVNSFTSVGSQFRLTGVISPSQLTGTTNDWNPTGLSTAAVIRVNTSAVGTDITGIAGGTAGRMLLLLSVLNSFDLIAESGGSSAANRIQMISSSSLNGVTSALLWYDGTASRWRVISAQTI